MTGSIAVLFISVVPGSSILIILHEYLNLDVWEKGIVAVILGAISFSLIFLIGQSLFGMTWITSVINILGPVSYVLLLIGTTVYAMVSGVPSKLGLPSSIFKKINVKSKKERWMVIASVVLMASILVASLGILSIIDDEGFTEFYVLNKDGHTYDYPTNVSIGESASIIVGVVNREGRAVNYTVEILLTNFTYIDQAVNVTQMYFVSQFSVVLENMEYDLNDPWTPQFEVEIDVSPQIPGDYQLMIMLFKDGAPLIDGTNPPDLTTDYSKTNTSWRVVMCVNNEINYLKLYLTVPE